MGAAAEDAVDAAANGNGNHNHDTMTTSSASGASSRYLVVFHAVSAGLNGAALGSDEQEIVFIVAVVLDVRDNQVLQKKYRETFYYKFLRDVIYVITVDFG